MNTVNCWIITEGMVGTENQCLAVAEHLNLSNLKIKRISLKFPFNILSPFILKTVPRWAIDGIKWDDPEPDLIIASGRKAVPVTLKFKNSFKVFIQDPKINPQYFNIVAAPMHDNIRGDNVIITHAAPNLITPEILNTARNKFDFSFLPKTKIAILIGGNSKSHQMPNGFAQALMESLLPYMNPDKYGFMVTVSRRTPPDILKQLQDIFSTPNCAVWDGTGDNPYHAYLAWADYILVTEDSTSMLSDALSTGKPTYRIPLLGGSEKFNRLYQNLKRRCMLRVFDGELDKIDYKPLNDAQKVADEIKKRFEKENLNR